MQYFIVGLPESRMNTTWTVRMNNMTGLLVEEANVGPGYSNSFLRESPKRSPHCLYQEVVR